MKSIFLLLFVISQQLQAQTNFVKQVYDVIRSSNEKFQKFRGEPVTSGNDSSYRSTIIIDGTKNNEIRLDRGITIYNTIVIDSVNLKQGKKVVDNWKNKLNTFLGEQFKLEQLKKVDWNPAKYGWKFVNGETWVDITLFPHDKISSLYRVTFDICRLDRFSQ